MVHKHYTHDNMPKPIGMTLDAFVTALEDKYVGDDIQLRGLDSGGYDILINGRAFQIDREKIESLTSKSELVAYIDALKVK